MWKLPHITNRVSHSPFCDRDRSGLVTTTTYAEAAGTDDVVRRLCRDSDAAGSVRAEGDGRNSRQLARHKNFEKAGRGGEGGVQCNSARHKNQ